MGATGAPLPTLLDQTKSPDSDVRYMALHDIAASVQQVYVGQALDARVEPAIVSQVLALLQDTHSDVKNLAVTTLGQLAPRVRAPRFAAMLEALCAALRSNDEEERDVASTAIRAILNELRANERCADTMLALVRALVPFLTAQIDECADARQTIALDVLNDVLTLAPSHIGAHQGSIAPVLLAHMASERSAVSRRAIQGLAHLAAIGIPATWSLITDRGLAGLAPPFHAEAASVHLLQALAREAPASILTQAPIRVEQLHSVLQRADERDETDELRESCLVALQAVAAAGLDVRTRLTIAHIAQSALAYDPNAAEDMYDMDDDDALDVSDDDDLAWRVRRAACRLLSGLFSAPDAHELCAAAPSISAALCERLREREEAVRLDALAALRLVWRKCSDTPLDSHVLVQALRTWRSASAQAAALTALSELAERHALAAPDGPAVTGMALYALENDAHAASYIAALVLVRSLLHCEEPAMTPAAAPLATALARAVLSTNHRTSFEALRACDPFFANAGPVVPEPACMLVDAVLARCERADADASVHNAGLVALDTALCVMRERLGERLASILTLLRARLSLETTRTVCLQIMQTWRLQDEFLGSFEPVQEFTWTCLPLLADLAQRPATACDALDTLFIASQMKRVPAHDVCESVCHIMAHGLPAPDSPALLSLLQLIGRLVKLVQERVPAMVEPLVRSYVPHLVRMSDTALQMLMDVLTHDTGRRKPYRDMLFAALVHAWVTQSNELGMPGAQVYAKALGEVASVIHTNEHHERNSGEMSRDEPGVLDRVEALLHEPDTASQTLGYLTIGRLGRYMQDWPKMPSVYAMATASTVPGQAMAVTGMLAHIPELRAPLVRALADGDVSALRMLRDAIKFFPYGFMREETMVWPSLMGPTLCAAAPDMTTECVAHMVAMDTKMELDCYREPVHFNELMQRLTAPDACGRAMVLGVLRAMLPLDSEHTLDPVLESSAPLILQRLSDEDVSVRQAAVMALHAYLQSRTALMLQALPPFLASLYDLTRVRPELQRQVRMGPFTVMHDDGLDLRKNALETLGALLDTALAQAVAPDVLACVVRALQDDDGVKLMGCLLVVHVADVAGEAVRAALADLAPPLQAILARQVRDNATKQEMEKASELVQAARRVVSRLAPLDPASPAVAELLERAASAPSAVRRAA